MMKKLKSVIQGDKSNGRIKWSLYGRVWNEVGRPYWKWLLSGVIFTVLAAGAEAFSITIVQKVVDEAFISKSLDAVYWLGIQVIVAFGCWFFITLTFFHFTIQTFFLRFAFCNA